MLYETLEGRRFLSFAGANWGGSIFAHARVIPPTVHSAPALTRAAPTPAPVSASRPVLASAVAAATPAVSFDPVSGLLTVTGTDNADVITVIRSGTNLVVNFNGAASPWSASSVRQLNINGGGENDLITLSADVTTPATLNGAAGNDTVTGGSGPNLLQGGSGNDSLSGGAGNDTVMGNVGDDSLDGGAGDDLLQGGAGSDTADYSSRTDDLVLTIGGGPISGAADEHDDISNDIENVRGGSGNDLITANVGSNPNSIFGNPSANGLSGGPGNDTLIGGAGPDTLSGGSDDDSLDGGLGADVLIGGSGSDTVTYLSRTSPLTIDAASGLPVSGEAGEHDLISSDIETLIGGSGNDTLIASDTASRLIGAGGNDTLLGGIGDDSLFGNAGNDLLVGRGGANSLNGGDDDDTLYGGDRPGETTFPSSAAGHNFLLGGDGNDSIVAGNGGDTLIGDLGNDTLRAGNGGDSLEGDEGNDSLFGGAGADVLDGGVGDDSLTAGTGAQALYGGDGTDLLTVPFADNAPVTLIGGDGNDTLADEGTGDGTLFGDGLLNPDGSILLVGSGDDSISGGSGSDSIVGGLGNDTLSGNDGNDTLAGDYGNDQLLGGMGDDTFVNLDGNQDSIDGGDGSNIVEADPIGQDLIVNAAATYDPIAINGTDTPDLPPTIDQSPALSRLPAPLPVRSPVRAPLSLTPVAPAQVYPAGAPLTMALVPAAPAATVSGGLLTANGSSANDTIVITQDSANIYVTVNGVQQTFSAVSVTRVSIDAGPGNDKVTFQLANGGNAIQRPATVLGGNGDDSIQGGSGADSLNGGAGNDTLLGGLGNDILNGGADNDLLNGGFNDRFYASGDGSDSFIGGGGIDTVDYSHRTANLTLRLDLTSATNGAAGEGDSFTTNTISNAWGGNGSDLIAGDSLANFISGGLGNDSLFGGAGNDNVLGGAGADSVYGNGDVNIIYTAGDGISDVYNAGLGKSAASVDAGIDVAGKDRVP